MNDKINQTTEDKAKLLLELLIIDIKKEVKKEKLSTN
jgi:hypothetical protein